MIEKKPEEFKDNNLVLYAPRPLWLEFLLTFFSVGFYSCFWFVGRARDFNKFSPRKFTPWLWFFVPFFAIAQIFALPRFINYFNELCVEKNHPKWNSYFIWVLACVVITVFYTAMDYLDIPDWTVFIGLFIWSVLMSIMHSEVNRFKKSLTGVTFKKPKLILSIAEWIVCLIMSFLCVAMFYFLVVQPSSVVVIEDLESNSSYVDPDGQFELPIIGEGWSIVEEGTYAEDESELELRGPYDEMYFILRKLDSSSYSINSLVEFRMIDFEDSSKIRCNEIRELASSSLSIISRVECSFRYLGSDETALISYIENDDHIFELYGYFTTEKKITQDGLQNFKEMAKGFEPL